MELLISDEKTKELLTEVVVDLLKTKRNVLYDIVLEAWSEVGLARMPLPKAEKMNLFLRMRFFRLLMARQSEI